MEPWGVIVSGTLHGRWFLDINPLEDNMNAEEIIAELRNFYGTTQYHRWSAIFQQMVITDGVLFLAQTTKCFWLLDMIASLQPRALQDPSLQNIQFWTLKVKDRQATLVCERDLDDPAFEQKVEFTDFPLPEIQLWVSDGVIYLPNEH
jgi:hypothetical protein